jgi:urease gamma subunit
MFTVATLAESITLRGIRFEYPETIIISARLGDLIKSDGKTTAIFFF